MNLRIKEIQEKKNISNVELAKKTGLGQQQISYYRYGKRTPTFASLEKLAEALQCHPLELLNPGEDFEHFYSETGEWEGIGVKIEIEEEIL